MSARTRPLVTAVLVLTAWAATACSGDSEPAPEPSESPSAAAKQPVERAADGLPVDYPRDEVPVLKGDVASATPPSKDFDGYTVQVLLDSDPAAAVADAVALLESSGWQAPSTTSPDSPAVLLTRDSGRVILTTNEQQGETALTYSVLLDG